jgi:phage terminase small subunit
LQRPHVQGRIAELERERNEQADKRGEGQDAVLAHWWRIVNHDPNELSQNRTGSCRYCWGEDHNFQWKTPREFMDAVRDAAKKNGRTVDDDGREVINSDGGFGYDITKEPNASCPECNGLGVTYQVFPDSRKLSPNARAAYLGVKVTQRGMEVITADKMQALDQIAKHLGMFKLKAEVDASEQMKAFIESISGGRAPLWPK